MILPVSWQQVPLGSLLTILRNGTTVSQSKSGIGIPITRIETISQGNIDLKRVGWVKEISGIEQYILHPGDILLSHINSLDQIGKSAIYDGIPPILIHGMNLLMLRCNQQIALPEYLLLYLRSEPLRQKIQNLANIAVNQASINQQSLSTILIDTPPLEEQKRIVEILELAEMIREHRLQATEKAKGLTFQLFAEMFLQNPERDKWPVVTVGEAGTVQLGRQRAPQYQTGRYTKPYLRVANVFEDKIDISDVLEMDFDAADFRKYRLSYGDILLNEGQSTELVGRPAMWRDELPECCFQNHLIRFKADLTRSYPDYALCLFLRYFKDGTFSRLSTKTSNIATLGLKRFVALAYPLPPMNLQEEFVRRVTTIRGVIDDIQAKKARTDNVLASLTAQAFNGTLTVRWREVNPDDSTQPIIENALITAPDEEKPHDTIDSELEEGSDNRALFWKDVPMESHLNAVCKIFSLNAYYNAEAIAERLSQTSHKALTEYEITAALDTLAAAGLILPVTLEIPDPANPSGAVVCINAYRLLRSGDNGRADFQTPQIPAVYALTDTFSVSDTNLVAQVHSSEAQ